MLFNNQPLSVKVFWALSVIIITTRLFLPFSNILTWDVFGYYLYLPAQFIYHDIGLTDMTWIHNIMSTYEPSSTLYQVNILPNGHGAFRYPCGEAVLNSPFFFMAHLLAKLFHYPADGFSPPYQAFYALGGLCYSVLGLYYFRKILVHFFDEKISVLVFILVVLGTNYFEQVTLQNTLTHHFLFTLYVLLIYNTIQWNQDFKKKNAFAIGLFIGLITITRANEAICLLIPLLWNIYDKESLKAKWQLLLNQKVNILLIIGGFLIGTMPQLLYWKINVGQWIYYSYEDPGVGFEFASPFIMQFLFSFRKGWFIYTPLMIFSVIGFYHLYKKNRSVFYSVLIYFIVNLYIVSSWSCWWYAGGSFSSRSMVSSYALMAIPFGYFLVQYHKKWVLGIFGLLLILNLFQTWQASAGILVYGRMTRSYYFKIFGKTSVTENDKKLLLVAEPLESVAEIPTNINFQKTILQALDFENETDKQRYPDLFAFQGTRALKMDSTTPFTSAYEKIYSNLTEKEYAWIKVSAQVYIPKENKENELPLIVIHFNNKDDQKYKYQTSEGLQKNTPKGKWIKISLVYMTPEVRSTNDKMKIYLWYRSKQPVFVDDFVIEKYEPTSTP